MQKHLHREMHGAEISGRSVGDLSRVGPYVFDEVVQRFPRRGLLHRQQRRIGEHACERHELINLIGWLLALQAIGFRDDSEGWQRGHDRVTVGLRARDDSMPDAASCSTLVLDHDLLSHVWDKWAARGRAAKSATPPGGNGTTSVIVRVGQGSCARSRSHPSQSPPEDKGSPSVSFRNCRRLVMASSSSGVDLPLSRSSVATLCYSWDTI